MESRAKVVGHAIHPMLIPFPLGLLATAFVFHEPLHMNRESLIGFTTIFVGGMFTAVADRSAICWVGSRQSLLASSHLKAALITLVQVMLPGWLLFGGAVLALMNARSGQTGTAVLGFWIVCCLLYAILIITHGRSTLPRQFRNLASGAGE